MATIEIIEITTDVLMLIIVAFYAIKTHRQYKMFLEDKNEEKKK